MKLLRVGSGNAVAAGRVRQIRGTRSARERRWRIEADAVGKLIDATGGRHTRSIVIMDSGHTILSSLSPEKLLERLGELRLIDKA